MFYITFLHELATASLDPWIPGAIRCDAPRRYCTIYQPSLLGWLGL
jgi:hypothetical protein